MQQWMLNSRFWYSFFPERNAGAEGFREGMQCDSTRYQWPLSHWFQPGPLPQALGF